jgi:hypothetical protein
MSVYFNGVLMNTSEYTLTGTTLTINRYLHTNDQVVVGSSVRIMTTPGSNTGVIFNNDGNLETSTDFSWDVNTNTLSVTNLTATLTSDGNLLPDNTNSYTIGNIDNRWDSLWLGNGGIHITDDANANSIVTLEVVDNVVEFDNAGGISANIIWGNTTIRSTANGNITFNVDGTSNSTVISNNAITVNGNANIGNLIIANGNATITYTPATATGGALVLSAANTRGGTGYADFLTATNTSGGATNPNKYFRLSNSGSIEVINSAYTGQVMSISDAGFMSVGSGYQINGKQVTNGPAFRAYIDTNQAITSGTQQKITFGGETFDTDSCFASSRFTPSVEGYYQLNSTVRIAGGTGTGEYMIILYKNGSEYARGNNGQGTEVANNFYSLQVSDIAYANGSSDYFEIYFQQTSGSSKDTTAGQAISHFSGVMVRGA